MAYRIGELTERVTFRKEVRTPDGYGGNTVTEEDVATVWAHVRPRSGSEQMQAGRVESRNTYLIVVRRREDLAASQTVVWRDYEMNVRSVPPVKPRAQFMEIEAELGVAT